MDDGPADQTLLPESKSGPDSPSNGTASDAESDSQPPSSSSPPISKSSSLKPHIRTKRSAWTDPSTSPHRISLLSGSARLRKLRHFADEDQITEKDYESRLRAQFERINPEPTWAKRARKQNREERESRGVGDEGGVGTGEAEEVDGTEKKSLFTSTSGTLNTAERRREGSVILPSGILSISRLRDANISTQDTASGEVKVVAFHPNDRVPILCVDTSDRRVRLYNVRTAIRK